MRAHQETLCPQNPHVFGRLFADPAQPEPLLAMLNALLGLDLEQLLLQPGASCAGALALSAWDRAGRRHHIQVEPGLARADHSDALARLARFYLRRLQGRRPEHEPCLGLHLRRWGDPEAHYHQTFQWREQRSQRPLLPHLALHAIALPTFAQTSGTPSSPGEHWLSFLHEGSGWAEAPSTAPAWVARCWLHLRSLSQEPGVRHLAQAQARAQQAEGRGEPSPEDGRRQRAAGQRQMLGEVVAYRLDRALAPEEAQALDDHLAGIALDGIRAYILEATREELEVWLLRLCQALGS